MPAACRASHLPHMPYIASTVVRKTAEHDQDILRYSGGMNGWELPPSRVACTSDSGGPQEKTLASPDWWPPWQLLPPATGVVAAPGRWRRRARRRNLASTSTRRDAELRRVPGEVELVGPCSGAAGQVQREDLARCCAGQGWQEVRRAFGRL
jgi:hypothetical protein